MYAKSNANATPNERAQTLRASPCGAGLTDEFRQAGAAEAAALSAEVPSSRHFAGGWTGKLA